MGVFRIAGVVAVVGAAVAATFGVSALASGGSGHHEPSASKLLARDPGGRLGGNTIVVTGAGGKVLGVHGRPNFIVSLGSNETIVGGGKGDELGALGHGDTIVAGRGGYELIHAGPGGKVVVGGSGHDLVIVDRPNATIDLESPGDEVIATGHDDHVVCSAHSFHDVIYVHRSDTVDKTCHRHHDQTRPAGQAPAAAASVSSGRSAHLAHGAGGSAARRTTVSGSGTTADPYRAPCDNPDVDPCTVSSFAPRTLEGFWSGEVVPAYQCPKDHEYLYRKDYSPVGTALSYGVEVEGLGPIGVSIPAFFAWYESDRVHVAVATATGKGYSSATSWATGSHSYKVILHCTSNLHDAWVS